jgi:hypothetical protein
VEPVCWVCHLALFTWIVCGTCSVCHLVLFAWIDCETCLLNPKNEAGEWGLYWLLFSMDRSSSIAHQTLHSICAQISSLLYPSAWNDWQHRFFVGLLFFLGFLQSAIIFLPFMWLHLHAILSWSQTIHIWIIWLAHHPWGHDKCPTSPLTNHFL